jgi:broad specificity phosphatase PhoE
MALIHLIRHGAPARTGLVLGGLDIPLASEEMEPSSLIVQSIVSSPKHRALRTAELLFPRRAITIINELAEISMGGTCAGQAIGLDQRASARRRGVERIRRPGHDGVAADLHHAFSDRHRRARRSERSACAVDQRH